MGARKLIARFTLLRINKIGFGLVMLVFVTIGLTVGALREGANHTDFLRQAFPQVDRFKPLGNDVYSIHTSTSPKESHRYTAWAASDGYAGPLKVALQTDSTGRITRILFIEQHETPSYFQRVQDQGLFETLVGSNILESGTVSKNFDAVSGATRTSTAFLDAAQKAGGKIAATVFKRDAPQSQRPHLYIGIPEIIVLALFAAAFAGMHTPSRMARRIRWLSLLLGLLVLGFAFNRPLNLVFINRLLMGYWPAWQSHLYWYLLAGAIILVAFINGRNPYCTWICPFGAMQECLGLVGGAKFRIPKRAHRSLQWLQKGLALGAVTLGLFFRNPSLSSYEIFGTLFDFIGSAFQFCLLALVMITALFVPRPWCNTLCPIRPLINLVRSLATRLKMVFRRS